MTTFLLLMSILGALLLGAMSPGPSFLLVSRTALAQSRGHGLAAALGMGVGGFVFAILALLGLIALLQTVEWLYMALRILGGLYLFYLAIAIWRGAKDPLTLQASRDGSVQSWRRSFWVGLVTHVSNPKTAVVYTSIFAVFLPAEPSLLFIMLLPPAVFAVEMGWYGVVALLFSARKPREMYLGGKRWFDRAASLVMGVLGARLISDTVR